MAIEFTAATEAGTMELSMALRVSTPVQKIGISIEGVRVGI